MSLLHKCVIIFVLSSSVDLYYFMQQRIDGRVITGGGSEARKSTETRERNEGFAALQALSLRSVLLDQRRRNTSDFSPESPRKVAGIKAEYTHADAYDAANDIVDKTVEATLESKTFQAVSQTLNQKFDDALTQARKNAKDDPSVRVEEWPGRNQLIKEALVLGSSAFLLRLHQDWQEKGKKMPQDMPEEIEQALTEYAEETAHSYIDGSWSEAPASRLAQSLFHDQLQDQPMPIGKIMLNGVAHFEHSRYGDSLDALEGYLSRVPFRDDNTDYLASLAEWIAPLAMKIRGYQCEPQRLNQADLASVEKIENLKLFDLEKTAPAMKAAYQEGSRLSKADQAVLNEKRAEQAEVAKAYAENQQAVQDAQREIATLKAQMHENSYPIKHWEEVNRYYLDRADTVTGDEYLKTLAESEGSSKKEGEGKARAKRKVENQREEYVAYVTGYGREDSAYQSRLDQLRRSENEFNHLSKELVTAWWPPTKRRIKARMEVLEKELDQSRQELNNIHANEDRRVTGNGQSYVSVMDAADKAEVEQKIYRAKQAEVEARLQQLEAESKKLDQRQRKIDRWLVAHTPSWREKSGS